MEKYINNFNEHEFDNIFDCMYDVVEYLIEKIHVPGSVADKESTMFKNHIIDYFLDNKIIIKDYGSYTSDEFNIADEIYQNNLDKKLLGE